jgi:hypothetical protein
MSECASLTRHWGEALPRLHHSTKDLNVFLNRLSHKKIHLYESRKNPKDAVI